jgi:carotenoid cleavage dioxygenase
MALPDLNRGALAPVADEVTLEQLSVYGAIPRDLNGTLIRNGPNPLSGRFQGTEMLDWWPEAAMLHGIELRDGAAVAYRNRWVRSRRWAAAHGAALDRWVDTNPNVNVVQHAGELLALAEGGPPLAISPDLDTLGPPRRHPAMAAGVGAHPCIDPVTGEMLTFRSSWEAPWLRYLAFAADGACLCDQPIDLARPTMMHDLAITATRSILFDLNVAYDFSLLAHGYRLPLRWHDEHRARIGLVPRRGGEVCWFEVTPCFIQHVVSAWDEGDDGVVLHAVRYPWFLRRDGDGAGFEPNPLGVLWRYRLDPASGRVEETQLSELAIELPRINESRLGRPHRYLYAVEQPTDAEMRGIVRYDLAGDPVQRFALPPGDQNSEPVFVARAGAGSADGEDDGYLLTCVYRHVSDTTELVILDAADIAAEPLARVLLPRRIPAGFHGAWIADPGGEPAR